MTRNLKNMKYLSIREHSGQRLIKELSGRDAMVVLDPTLVVSDDFWLERTHAISTKSYMLCYFLSEPKKDVLKYIGQISSRTGMKIVCLPYKNNLLGFNGAELVEKGPFEFLDILRNADFVCTDSYHGTAFSLIFERPFISFSRNQPNEYNQTTRIHTLLKSVSLEERYMDSLPEFDEEILFCDFLKSKHLLEQQRTRSLKYLWASLNLIGDDI